MKDRRNCGNAAAEHAGCWDCSSVIHEMLRDPQIASQATGSNDNAESAQKQVCHIHLTPVYLIVTPLLMFSLLLLEVVFNQLEDPFTSTRDKSLPAFNFFGRS
ncbi:hypothetical protein [Streptomyces sp. NPDC101237]|uniref:hypothetical protein n=1 Tax=Streptomyces sp. NPDC101237 TaxID=3366139 RepID=UPI003815B632